MKTAILTTALTTTVLFTAVIGELWPRSYDARTARENDADPDLVLEEEPPRAPTVMREHKGDLMDHQRSEGVYAERSHRLTPPVPRDGVQHMILKWQGGSHAWSRPDGERGTITRAIRM